MKGPEKMMARTLRNAAKDFFFFFQLRVFEMSFCSAGMLQIFFFFWLHWVFVAVRGLSLVAVSGGYSSLRCAGFSLSWLFVAEHGL